MAGSPVAEDAPAAVRNAVVAALQQIHSAGCLLGDVSLENVVSAGGCGEQGAGEVRATWLDLEHSTFEASPADMDAELRACWGLFTAPPELGLP